MEGKNFYDISKRFEYSILDEIIELFLWKVKIKNKNLKKLVLIFSNKVLSLKKIIAINSELDFPLLAGIVGAILHVVSGPDHLVAVALFAIEEKKKAENWAGCGG